MDLKNFNYIKDSAGDLTNQQLYLQSGAKVLNGCDPTTVYALMAGAVGSIWGGANYMPHETVKLYSLIKSGDLASALDLWQKMIPSLLHIWTHDYIQCVLVASHARGFGLGNVRRPLLQLKEKAKKEMLDTLRPLEIK